MPLSLSPFKKIIGTCSKVISSAFGSAEKKVSRRPKMHVRQPLYYSPEKQRRLEVLCESLFEQKDLIAAGKLQVIGLAKVKRNLGKKWRGLQQIVYLTVEEAIEKYMMPNDLFIRYHDDTYVIIYAEASPEEAQIKSRLIAEEIKRKLFAHEEKELQNLDIEESVAPIKTSRIKPVETLPKTMHKVSGEIDITREQKAQQERKSDLNISSLAPTIDIDPYESNRKKEEKPEEPLRTPLDKLKFHYVPLWDVKRNILTTYLALALDEQMPGANPLDSHEKAFLGSTPSEKAKIDIYILNKVALELEKIHEEDRRIFVACPVHYDTLYRTDNLEKYLLACQQIPQEHKKSLVFLVLDLPGKIHKDNVMKFTGSLRSHCMHIFAQVPLSNDIEFTKIRDCRFDAIGVRVKKVKGGEKQLMNMLEGFSQKAKGSLISKIFLLDVASLSVTTSSVCADYDFMGGSAIHETVGKPDNIYRFKYENLFTDLLKEQ